MKITILPGINKDRVKEGFDRIDLSPGDTVSIVGNTGSGKSAFINDIEVLAQNDTITCRRVLIDDKAPSEEMVRNPAMKPIAMITQNTRIIADLTVAEFISHHARARQTQGNLVEETIDLANKFTGEKVVGTSKISSLSGGQTKAILIADALAISRTPILLLDEVENAGIYKDRFISLLKQFEKTVIFVTHNPLLSLITNFRIVMKNGGVDRVLTPGDSEARAVRTLKLIDSYLMDCREKIRNGELIQ